MTEEKKLRGFARLSPEVRREIARRGGIAGHVQGTAHEYTPETAKEAGRRGGIATKHKREAERISKLDDEVIRKE